MNKHRDSEGRSSKRQAFLSFLQPSSTTIESNQKKNNSDHEQVYQQQYVEQSNQCNVCSVQLPPSVNKHKTNCGFCEMPACKDHMRKRRRKKNKWEKICDNCQDKFLFDCYMKLEIKSEEALLVQEQIITMKYESQKQLLESKQTKRRQLSFTEQRLTSRYDEQMTALDKQQNKFLSLNNRIESDQLACNQIQQYIARMQKKIKQNYQQDYRILDQQNDKMGRQLTRVQKKCAQIRMAINKRQKQLEDAYQEWQRKQFRRSIEDNSQGSKNSSNNRKRDDCAIF